MFLNKWNESKVDVFWGGIAPCEHVVQVYESERAFIDLLAEFVIDGVRRDETVVIILSADHFKLLEERLSVENYDAFKLRLSEKLIIEDAHETLSKFMIGDWPDEILFRHVIGSVLARAQKNKRHIRAFGEMVVLLMARGLPDATLQLEHMWNDLQQSQTFSLFCAYPRSVFSKTGSDSILSICGAHSKIVATVDHSVKNVVYKDLTFHKNN